ncbi:MAG: hypothetical protein Kow0047_32690 [Anaerolineae bacterium]
MRSSEFMRRLPDEIQSRLPPNMPRFKARVWNWGCHLYEETPRLHYETVRTSVRFGDRLEMGLHFESRSPQVNQALLAFFQEHLVEVKASLGEGFEAEPWDRGWTKVYETIPLQPYDHEFLAHVADRMAQIITVLDPLFKRALESVRSIP